MGTGTTGIILRTIVGIICVVICFLGVVPALTGRFHAGCITMVLVGTVGVLVCIGFPSLSMWIADSWKSGIGKAVLCSAAGLGGALILLFIGVSGCMVAACLKEPREDATVIVLGAALRGDQPSLSLKKRLDAAYEHLTKHPQAVCIVSGGQGADEICTEAGVMKRVLVEKGIDPQRIYVEESSASTFENIEHSRALIQELGLTAEVAIVTQEFHQFRAQQMAKRAGLTVSGAVTAHSPWYLLPSYWIRDFAGVCHMVLLGT